MKTVYLLRHAKAEAATQMMHDPERPLAAIGRDACKRIGAYMASCRYNPACAIVSPALRTRETFDLVVQAAGLSTQATFEKQLYMASSEDIIESIQQVDDSIDSLLVVGHNPGMHHVAVTLSEPDASPLYDTVLLKYPTGTLTVLQFEVEHWQDIRPETGLLLDCTSPKSLLGQA